MWRNHAFACSILLFLLKGTAAFSQEEVSEAALAAIEAAISHVKSDIALRNRERAEVYQTLQQNEEKLVNVTADITRLENQITGNERRLADLQSQSRILEDRKDLQQTLIKQYVRSAYQTGQQEYFKLLFNQENPDQASRTLGYYRYFSAARSQAVTAFNNTLTELRDTQDTINTTTLALNDQRIALENQRVALRTTMNQRQDLLDELDVKLSSSAQKLAALEAERAEMTLLIEELRRSIADLALGNQEQPFVSLKGKLAWPVAGRLQNSWGSAYGLGDLTYEGVTIAADLGADVHAVHHGRVVFSDWFSSSGLLLIIDHGDGYMSLYAHNQALFKDVGEWVSSGEIIAAVGNTGGQGESGLYFEIRHNGSSENPSAWCQARN